MSWTNFKEKYLFGINFAIMVSAILFAFRKDWVWHPAVAVLLVSSLFFPQIIIWEKNLLMRIGKINSVIILTTFYFFFLTPFSLFYKTFFRNPAFKPASSRFIKKEKISAFEVPF